MEQESCKNCGELQDRRSINLNEYCYRCFREIKGNAPYITLEVIKIISKITLKVK